MTKLHCNFNVYFMIGVKLKNITRWHVLLVWLLWSHQTLFGIQVCPKNVKRCVQKKIVGNGQITHNFFDFQKFFANMAFFAFLASIIQDNACRWSTIITIYKNHVLSSKGQGYHPATQEQFTLLCDFCVQLFQNLNMRA